MSFRHSGESSPFLRLFIFVAAIYFVLLILTIRLFHLTIVKGAYYRRLSESNRIREHLVEPNRGTITDRNGVVLAKNIPADVNRDDERIFSKRDYEFRDFIGPIIGYRQTADTENLQTDNCLTPLHLGDKVGKKGIEKKYDCVLRGTPGKKLIEVDARGKFVRTLSVLPSTDGATLKLALNIGLQKKAMELIKDKRATIIALDPMTGEILILASSPSYSPQDFEDKVNEKIESYLTNREKPLFNRALEGTYPPGSIFKLVVASAALQEKAIDEKTLVEDTGTIKAGPLSFGNWYYLQYGKTDGQVDIIKGIKRSNDIFFYKTAEAVGPDKIKIWAERFGFGKKTEIGLEEAEGIVPSPFWKKETLKEQWYLGDTYNYSIGQGYTLVTPMQIALSTAVFANNGKLCDPQLLKVGHGSCSSVGLDSKNLLLIQEGMREACSPGGTGYPFFDFRMNGQLVQTACKTGTAESHAENGAPHAWFTLFAPYQNPRIVITVLVEEAGQGSDIAAPMAKEILSEFLSK